MGMARKRMDKRIVRRTLFYAAILTVAVLLAEWLGAMRPLERFWYDTRARYFQFFTQPPTDRIVHINIDDPTLKEIGSWPWHRSILAEIVDELHLAGAKVIGFDVIFSEPQPLRYEKQPNGTFQETNDDQRFAASIRSAGNVLLPISAQLGERGDSNPPQFLQSLERFTLPLPPHLPSTLWADSELPMVPVLMNAARYSGVVQFSPDPDGVARSVPLFIKWHGRLIPHMALASYCAMLGVEPASLKVSGDELTIPLTDGNQVVPLHSIPTSNFGQVGLCMDLPWFGRPDHWQTMYDYPEHRDDQKQRVALQKIWAIHLSLAELARNNREVDDALRSIVDFYPSEQIKAFLAKPQDQRDAERSSLLPEVLKDMQGSGMDEAGKDPTATEAEQKLAAAYAAVRKASIDTPKVIADIANGRASLKQTVAGRYALIGWTATGMMDQYTTSIDPLVPGAVIHGVVFNALATNQFWRRAPGWVEILATLLIAALTTLAVMRLSNWFATGAMLLIAFGYLLINGLVLFDYFNLIVPGAGPAVAAALICFGVTVARFIYEQSERSRITRRFSSMVDPALVNHFIDNPDARFDGQLREMSVVFTDLAGFTTISEKLRERTVKLLNRYMRLMMPIIRGNRGHWNKFLGDGIMFFYNALNDNPHHARDAVHTVLEMQKAMEPFNQELVAEGLPRVIMRAGISTGEMVVGDAGSDHPDYYASDYTVLGDDVNLGARLESANKALGSRVLINARAADLVKETVLLRPMGLLRVVGKTEPVMTFEAMALLSEATDDQKRLAHVSTRMIDCYLHARFGECLELAEQIDNTYGSSKYTLLYKNLCRDHLASAPENFNGVVVLQEK
jgi:class 3 adenylate cyclase/CHASE2 domain-containing sensor protein